MSFNANKALAGLITLLLFYMPHLAKSAEKNVFNTTLKAQPTSCITLHQGRECYTNITINWQSRDIDEYCLHQAKNIVHCWQKSNNNKATFTFESAENITFYLTKRHSDKVLAETTITVGWVHKATPRKRRWRLF